MHSNSQERLRVRPISPDGDSSVSGDMGGGEALVIIDGAKYKIYLKF